jgi:hypothetical protein
MLAVSIIGYAVLSVGLLGVIIFYSLYKRNQ